MIPTAKDHGLKTDWFIDERSDFEKSTVAAAKYLKMLAKMFDNDWHLVLAAYNGGQGRVQRAMKRAGTDDFWDLSETQKYSAERNARVRAADPGRDDHRAQPGAVRLRDRDRRGARLRKSRRSPGRSTCGASPNGPAPRSTRSRRSTRSCAAGSTPLRYADYEVKVPAGTGDQFRSRLAAATAEELNALKWHTVRKGETLDDDRAQTARRARLSSRRPTTCRTKSRVAAGQDLIIPRPPTTLLATRTERAAPAVAASRPVSGTAPVPEASRASVPQPTTYYKVKRGDTLSRSRVCSTPRSTRSRAGTASAAIPSPPAPGSSSAAARQLSTPNFQLPRHSALERRVAESSAIPHTPCPTRDRRFCRISPAFPAKSPRFATALPLAPPRRMLACMRSAAVFGIEACRCQVEVDVSLGLPCFNMVGLPDASVRESRDRDPQRHPQLRLRLPGPPDHGQPRARRHPQGRIVVRSADRAGRARRGRVRRRGATSSDVLLIGELSLDGGIQAARGVLPIAAAARRDQFSCAAAAAPQSRRGGGRRRAAPVRRPLADRGGARAERSGRLHARPRSRRRPHRRCRRRNASTAISATSTANRWRAGRSRSRPPAGTTR